MGSIALHLDGGLAELRRFYVARDARGSGLGSLLYEFCEAEARRGACRIELLTDSRMTNAHRFYERAGYVRLPGEKRIDPDTIKYRYAKEL